MSRGNHTQSNDPHLTYSLLLARRAAQGHSYLFDACEEGRVDDARLLLEDGADTEETGEHHDKIRTPLWIACDGGHADVVQLLLEHGADIACEAAAMGRPLNNKERRRGKFRIRFDSTPLFVACHGGHVDVARLLLEYGADVDAVSWVQPACCDWELLICGRDSVRREYDYGCADEESLQEHMRDYNARYSGKHQDETYHKQYREFSKEEQGMQPLLIACIEGHVDVARLCLEYGADIDQRCGDRHGIIYDRYKSDLDSDDDSDDEEADDSDDEEPVMTPMSVACKKQNGDLIKLLLEHGADEDDVVLPSLQTACDRGDVSLAELILEYTDDRSVDTHWSHSRPRGAPRVYRQPIVRLLRKDYAMSFYLNVIGHRDEHPERQERAHDVVRRVVSYLTPRARQA